jgi:molybdopterin molybdotransferase
MAEQSRSTNKRSRNHAGPLISVDEAQSRILARFSPLEPSETRILESIGLVLADEIVSSVDVPSFTNSAMDGYALRAEDTAGATAFAPATLNVVGVVEAGQSGAFKIAPGTAIRIMTGAIVPDGANAVVRFEEIVEVDQALGGTPNSVQVMKAAFDGENIRLRGEEIEAGSIVLERGAVVGPRDIGLLATINRVSVNVVRRPHVAILSTCDEIVDVGSAPGPGQILNSNGYLLAAMAKQFGAEPTILGIVPDCEEAVRSTLRQAASFDLIVTSGGVAQGDRDIVGRLLQTDGTIDFRNVAIKPGRPVLFGSYAGAKLLGLPGNPAAAAVCFEQFGRPSIKRMLGRRDLAPPALEAVLTERIENRGHKRSFVNVAVEADSSGTWHASVVGRRSTSAVASPMRSRGLLVIPETVEVAELGARFIVQMVDWTAELPFTGAQQE